MSVAAGSNPPSEERPILITGATGFVGLEVMVRCLQRSRRQIIAPVRARDDAHAAERIRHAMGTAFGDPDAHAGRVTAVAADIERPDLGLEPRRLDALAERIDRILHAAASVSFDLGLAESRGINVSGTQHMLDFADRAHRRGGLARFTYVSTAYVAGTHRGEFSERDYDVGQGFRNAYERSKWESEGNVRAAGGRLPVQIARPSIIVGEQASGWTSAFNVLYGPLRALSTGAFARCRSTGEPRSMWCPSTMSPMRCSNWSARARTRRFTSSPVTAPPPPDTWLG